MLRVQRALLVRSELEEGEDLDGRFLRVSAGKAYGSDIIEYRCRLTRTFDVMFEVIVNGRVLLSEHASETPQLWVAFQSAAADVRMEMTERQRRMREMPARDKAKMSKDVERVFEEL